MSVKTTAEPWSGLKHPLVRNLAWCIFSPSLAQEPQNISSSDQNPTTFRICQPLMTDEDWQFLSLLDQSPATLQEWMNSNHTTRLGFQFEYYWQFWWRYRQTGQEHRFNVQLTHEGKTLGELDALSWNPETHELTHSEMAVKFYLGIESKLLPPHKRSQDRFSWVGPNIVDRFDLKWDQLSQRQLQHLQNSRNRSEDFLPKHWDCSHLHTQLIMRGRLFYPFKGTVESNQQPYINPDHHRGLWMKQHQFVELLAANYFEAGQNSTYWVVLRRDQWFAPLCVDDDSVMPKNQESVIGSLHAHFQKYSQPVQVALLSQSRGTWVEVQRVFVVPDQWPATT